MSSAYIDGTTLTLPLTGPSERPVHWTLLAGASASQREVETAVQQTETVASLLALNKLHNDLSPVLWSVTSTSITPAGWPYGTSSETAGTGPVWEKGLLGLHLGDNGQGTPAASVVFCRDQRTGASVRVGSSVRAVRPTVSLLVYQLWKEKTSVPHYGAAVRWRAGVPGIDTGLVDLSTCQAWARTHTSWPGPSAG